MSEEPEDERFEKKPHHVDHGGPLTWRTLDEAINGEKPVNAAYHTDWVIYPSNEFDDWLATQSPDEPKP